MLSSVRCSEMSEKLSRSVAFLGMIAACVISFPEGKWNSQAEPTTGVLVIGRNFGALACKFPMTLEIFSSFVHRSDDDQLLAL
ncbi:hypothetical protein F5890DRAFT_1586130 [Lentinula detonsa]|uniref:Uncharacterized protein n=1 Tax=Lentinula detonsa TaxID=2804962 RepID=A0AA38PZ02_9AGAR|nr:hypothetical protein F5890DRAFT_1586130 [Lentinula detonsa]